MLLGAAPAVAAAPGVLADLTLTPDLVVSGQPVPGTVTLTATATSDTVVSLSSTDTSVLTVPATVIVPAGTLSAPFTATTIAFTGPGSFACVNGSAGGGSAVDCVNINPVPSGPVLQSITFAPNPVQGGSPATGTVTFATVTDGAGVSLTSSNPAVVQVPASALVPGGKATGAFPVATSAVTVSTTVTVTGTAFGVTRTATITVVPATGPPQTDVVRITRATWRRGLLRIDATSTNPNAILSVYLTASDSFMFNLTNLGSGRYTDQRGWVFNPLQITVKSNFGGTATASTA